MQIDYDATDAVRQAIARLGRTEDLAFSPDGLRLAIAGFACNRVLVIDVEVPGATSGAGVRLTGALEIHSAALAEPHGVSFIDADTRVVANRAGRRDRRGQLSARAVLHAGRAPPPGRRCRLAMRQRLSQR
jgi:hypothetical protein